MIKEFNDIVDKARASWIKLHDGSKPLVLIGTATCGRSAGSIEVLKVIKKEVSAKKINLNIIEVGCIGLCYAEPIICVFKKSQPGICYGEVTDEKALKIFNSHIVKDKPVAEYALGTIGEEKLEDIPSLYETPVFKHQIRRVLKNCGFIDPTNINHALAMDGYTGLKKVLQMNPNDIILEMKNRLLNMKC